ncbi:P2Y purinoceptor 3 [Aplochiton taeniatus]
MTADPALTMPHRVTDGDAGEINDLNALAHDLLNSTACSIDESYKYIFLPICYSFTFVFSISLNFVVLYRSFRRTKRWNASLIYMVNLASTDFMYGLSLPFLVASYVQRDAWVFGDFMCRLVRFLFYFNLYCSIFFLTCISVHRYLGICHPMKTVTMETKRAVKGTCVVVWAVVFALTCPIFRFAQTGQATRLTGAAGGVLNVAAVSAVTGNISRGGSPGLVVEAYLNCWDDAIDQEFPDYIPYGITLHLLGFFVPFTIIAWCYSHVVLTIFRTLHSQPSRREKGGRGRNRGGKGGGGGGGGARRGSRPGGGGGLNGGGAGGTSVFLGAHSPYAHRRRKSIKTIITITLLFALCFFPFHVTKTVFLILKVRKDAPCHIMAVVSMCYKVTRPLASFNAWLNALLYFLTKEKSATCCRPPSPAATRDLRRHGLLLWPLKKRPEREADGEEGQAAEEGKDTSGKRSAVYIHRALPKVTYTVG